MKRAMLLLFLATTLTAQTSDVAQRVADDAMAIDRVAEVSKRDLPRDVLKRIIDQDIDLLRGKRPDGSYQYATWERFEAGRISNSFSVQTRKDKMDTLEIKGTWVYRIVVDIPARRLVVRKNRPIWIERVDVDYVAEGRTQSQVQTFDVKAWLQPGEIKPIDLPVIARQVTAKVIATADPKGGYGNVDVALVQAKIVDKADSPYADAVSSAKAIQRGLDNGEIPSIRAMAQRLRSSLGTSAPVARPATAEVTVRATETAPAAQIEMQAELQLIEDLLTGSDSERRQGLDRLHQLIRKMRP
ncbi:MAG TPA: hypothetical protein VJZ00_08990 [Thermoanaerobaculia bacterium]|nr:hypothetical protein [Thermoanaerobaculia bacterium]